MRGDGHSDDNESSPSGEGRFKQHLPNIGPMKATIKKLISSTPLVGPGIRRLRKAYHAWQHDAAWHIRRALRGQANPCVVQIGSNDGNTNDPLHKLLIDNPAWQALLIEPVPFLFEKLVANYPREDRFKFANVAVAETA